MQSQFIQKKIKVEYVTFDDEGHGFKKAKNIAETIETKVGESKDIPAGAVPTNVMQQIESTPVPESLMARTAEPVEEPMQEEEPKSLLERG